MIRKLAMSAAAAVAALLCAPASAWAQPVDADVFVIGKCFDASQAPQQRPARFAYNCDHTGVMQDMVWTGWDAKGAVGTGTDKSVECQPNCAQGPTLVNPIAVRAFNPLPPPADSRCPADIRYYSDLTIAYPHGVPPWIKPGTTWDTGTDFVTVDGVPAVHFSGLRPNCNP